MDKFQNKYRIPSARLQNWDYRWSAAYFITICTQHRMHYFGEIVDGKMQLSSVGIIADILWYEIKYHTKNIELGEFVVMPNHIHGILILMGYNGDDEYNQYDGNNGNNGNDGNDGNVETGHALSLPPPPPPEQQFIGKQRFQNIGKNSVSSIIGSYKSAVSKHANRLGKEFMWQSRFYDHIIRNDKSYQKISNYIINNPTYWQEDNFFKPEENK